jgi:hypothetical protein
LCADQAGNDQLSDGEARRKCDGAELNARFSFVAGQWAMLDIGWEEMLTCPARILAFGEERIATSKSLFCKLLVKNR